MCGSNCSSTGSARRRARWSNGLCDLLCLGFAVTATVLGARYVQESALFGISFAHSNLPFPLWAAQSVIPIGFAAISLRLLLRLIGIRPDKPVASAEA